MRNAEIAEIIAELEHLHTALTTHERDIAQYTKWQTAATIFSAITGALTTAILLLLTSSQLQISANQFDYETRKTSPSISVGIISGDSLKDFNIKNGTLDVVRVKFEKNESEVRGMEILRDFRITKTVDEASESHKKVYNCIFRTSNFTYPVQGKSGSAETSYYATKFSAPQESWRSKNILNARYDIVQEKTIARISYQDVMGVYKIVIYSGNGAMIFRDPADKLPQYDSEVVEIRASDWPADTEIQHWLHPIKRYFGAGCQHLTGDGALVNFEDDKTG